LAVFVVGTVVADHIVFTGSADFIDARSWQETRAMAKTADPETTAANESGVLFIIEMTHRRDAELAERSKSILIRSSPRPLRLRGEIRMALLIR
jgi:hypothetical protein